MKHEGNADTIFNDTLGMVPKVLEKRVEKLAIKGKIETMHCKSRLGYSEESWRYGETCCHLNSSEKNHQRVIA